MDSFHHVTFVCFFIPVLNSFMHFTQENQNDGECVEDVLVQRVWGFFSMVLDTAAMEVFYAAVSHLSRPCHVLGIRYFL